MHKLIGIPLLLIICGCAPKISEHFQQNKYVRKDGIHILNDSLQLSFKSKESIQYISDTNELIKTNKQLKFSINDPIIVYGKNSDPAYVYAVTLSENKNQKYPKDLVVFDTLINNQILRFLGKPLAQNAKGDLEADLKNSMRSVVVGPSYRQSIGTLMDILSRHNQSNKYLAVLNDINQFPTYNPQEDWTKLQLQLTYASFLGNNHFYDTYINQLESRIVRNDTLSQIIKEHIISGCEVVKTIIKEAKFHRVVMINENHYYPNHRLLVSDVLAPLKNIGYTHLALEALDMKQDSVLNLDEGYPNLKTGFYTSEQNYGNLIREAKELGYTFVAYENAEKNKDRELGQAENLYNKTFKLDANIKVLVLAGIDHILERPTPAGKQWMATIFKNKYDIDPLTISQTHLNAYRKEVQASYGIINSKFFESEKLQSVDYLVLNNNRIDNPENTSLLSYQNKSNTEIQIALLYGREMVDKSEHQYKVPYFSSLLKPGERSGLPIKKNVDTYLFTFDGNGKQIDSQFIIDPDSPINKQMNSPDDH